MMLTSAENNLFMHLFPLRTVFIVMNDVCRLRKATEKRRQLALLLFQMNNCKRSSKLSMISGNLTGVQSFYADKYESNLLFTKPCWPALLSDWKSLVVNLTDLPSSDANKYRKSPTCFSRNLVDPNWRLTESLFILSCTMLEGRWVKGLNLQLCRDWFFSVSTRERKSAYPNWDPLSAPFLNSTHLRTECKRHTPTWL